TGTEHVNNAMEDFVSSSVTLTPEREYEDESGENFRTRLASDRYVVLTSSSEAENIDVYASAKVNLPIPYVQTQAEAIASSRLAWFMRPGLLPLLVMRPHACMMSELRLRCDYEITVREMFEKKFMKSSETIQQKDAEIVSLKARLQRAEGEATEVIRIRGQVSKLDTTVAVWVKELADLGYKNVVLLGQDLHGEIGDEARMREEFMSIQDAEAQRILMRNAKLDARIAELNYDMDTELYPNMMTAMAGRRWMIGHGLCLAMMKCSLEAGVEHGKVGRSLVELEAYDSRVVSKYVSAVNELKNVSFPLLDQLEALKELELLMSSLMLERGHGDEDPTLEFRRRPDSICHEILLSDDLAASHVCTKKRKKDASLSLAVGGPSAVVLGLAASSLAPHVSMPSVGLVVPSTSSHETSLVIADYPISSLIIVDDTILATETHDDLFDTTVLDKPEDHQLY
ncbi:hypothetical protein Tco_1430992, partial [Tanacetum coccineum]